MRRVSKSSPRQEQRTVSKEPLAEAIIPLDSRGKQKWASMSDEELVGFAQKFVNEKKVESKKGLLSAHSRLYRALKRRKLIDKIEFSGGLRSWKKYSNDELVAYAQRLVDEKEIVCRNGLRGSRGLYNALAKRKLLDRLEFKANERAWRFYSDDELVAFAQKFVDKRGIGKRSWLRRADGGLYNTLERRELIDKVKLQVDERAWKRYSNDELVAYAQKFVAENGIKSRTEFSGADGGLYATLLKRKLMDGLKFKADERAWRYYSDDELVAYAQKFVAENEVRSRGELHMTSRSLYDALWGRNLLSRVFSSIEQDKESQGMQEITEAISEFCDD